MGFHGDRRRQAIRQSGNPDRLVKYEAVVCHEVVITQIERLVVAPPPRPRGFRSHGSGTSMRRVMIAWQNINRSLGGQPASLLAALWLVGDRTFQQGRFQGGQQVRLVKMLPMAQPQLLHKVVACLAQRKEMGATSSVTCAATSPLNAGTGRNILHAELHHASRRANPGYHKEGSNTSPGNRNESANSSSRCPDPTRSRRCGRRSQLTHKVEATSANSPTCEFSDYVLSPGRPCTWPYANYQQLSVDGLASPRTRVNSSLLPQADTLQMKTDQVHGQPTERYSVVTILLEHACTPNCGRRIAKWEVSLRGNHCHCAERLDH